MPARVLVVYASRAGSTAEVAEAVGQRLRERGCVVDVHAVREAPAATEYDAVVLGSAVWVGKPLPEAIRFLSENQDALRRRPIAYFVLCDTLKEDTPANRERAHRFTLPLSALVEPVSTGYFAGARSFRGLNPILLWLLKRVVHLEEGDWRDWSAIDAWSASLADALHLPEGKQTERELVATA